MTRLRRLAWLALAAAAGCGKEPPSVAVDREPPAVIALLPADGATAVPAQSPVEVLFSEPVVIDTLGGPPLRIEGPAGPLAGVALLDSTATVLAFVPAESLAAATDFRLVVAAGIADRSGNARPDSLVARFSTALAFLDLGWIFVANQNSRDLSVFEVESHAPVAGSPVPLGVRPVRLRGVPEEGALYVLYSAPAGGGVLALDARALAVRRDSGPILPPDASDLAVSPEDGLVLVVSPSANAMFVLDASTLAAARAPLIFERAGSEPVRVALARRLRWALVGLEDGARLAAYRLPALVPVAGFPAPAVRRIHTIAVDEERARAWVGGSLRYAVVDLLAPARTVTFEIPNLPGCQPLRCAPRIWSMILSPAYDRVYLLNRRDAVASVGFSDLDVATELSGRLRSIVADLVQDPRTGELVIVEARSVEAPTTLVDPRTLCEIHRPMPVVGDGPVDMEVLP
jgi:hypothetical protein